MKTAIATTTIFPISGFLDAYYSNIQKYDHLKDVKLYIAGDRKSPANAIEIASTFREKGIDVNFLDIEWQNDYLKRFPNLKAIIPENSDNRRNVAYLLALEEGADVIISVDDDNFPIADADFVEEHLSVGKVISAEEAIGHNQWFNLCTLLESNVPDEILYPRGFPYHRRDKMTSQVVGKTSGKIGVNVGLWLLDPDTDAIGRLNAHPHVSDWKKRNTILGKGVRTPINTQNTALSREAMTAYYYVRMGEMLRGMRLDRFGDILSGYFVQLCADAVGDRIRIGSPIAEHRRNQHNLLIDLYNELAGIMLIEDLSGFLETVQLPNTSYYEAYYALSMKLEEFADNCNGFIWQPETKAYIRKIGSYMRIWADAVSDIIRR
jgi:hypothetical protein